ncbi:MAG: very short patch repair endonuclease [Alphaproteobacteria bacterium]|nr:very short patch repair endonuclease [Alphaproteobacteria bacterium]
MPATRSEQMARIPREDTKPETRLRKALWQAGVRGYRKHARTPAGRPDLVFPGPRLAVFLDGCFWHGCPDHYSRPRSREDFWAEKLRANIERDRRQTAQLEAEGWRVLRVWEHEVYEDLPAAVERVRRARDRRQPWAPEPSWRVTRVVGVHDTGDIERRVIVGFREVDLVRVVEGPRVTRKW